MLNKKREKMYFALFSIAVCMIFLMNPVVVLASQNALNAVKEEISLFGEIVAAVISGIGSVITMWAFMKMGMAMQNGGQGGMEAQSFNAIIGGLVVILAPQLVLIFTS